ncbi:Beta-barrel assembly machine subunit BamD [Tistlia consotensis]|uniref:Outer membrane protein assembly factor BamD n=1 Tax=Tistlia consotensis USBA 355 TaxID=560819 RepID=A0A1Y6CLD4_9PROT|nr:outer membrane protein assembly factor BamD [Tistlia consotensis]SMF71047.1 Beta-barrel assembly machine subunit BamD [Tistlia consotensis USBA 355]SNS06779.1 Beta-barrel assembly machine subunit BamD [Tistlia consotensis]
MWRRFLTALRLPLLAVLLAAALAGCSGKEKPTYVEEPPEQLYNKALSELLAGDYEKSAKSFDEVERQHPYSVWASRAQLMSAYAFYQGDKYDDAINALDRFIQLNPGSRDIAYAYYLKAICYYEQISDVGRDQKNTIDALDSLKEVVRRFPESRYARDAQLKIDLARDHLAGKDMEIGRYYESHGEYLAAINRFQTVIKDYQTTTHVPEALHRLVECYLALGVYKEAEATAAVLGYNFPGSEWYQDSYALLTGKDLRPADHEGSWISQVWHTVF